jgi:CheY-like chemotaxis protein
MTKPPNEIRALIADPSAHMADLVALMLRSLGIRSVDNVRTLADAVSRLGTHPYGLVLIEAELCIADHFAALRTLRQAVDHPNRHVPVIMMAASPDVATVATARDAGINEFLRKPFSAEHIKLRLDSIQAGTRQFVETEVYTGPDRRRRTATVAKRRRASDAPDKQSA